MKLKDFERIKKIGYFCFKNYKNMKTITLPTKWTESQLCEIYWRLRDFDLFLCEQEERPKLFVKAFYEGIDADTTYFILNDSQQVTELCIFLRIVGWETINDIPWTDIEKVFRFSQDTLSLKKVFNVLQSKVITQFTNPKQMSMALHIPMFDAEKIFERLDMLSSPILNRAHLCTQKNRLPFLKSKYTEDELSVVYYWTKNLGLISCDIAGMYDFVHIFNRAICEDDVFVKFNWCGTLKQLSYFIEKIMEERPQKKDWETVCHCFSYKEGKPISSDSIRAEHSDGGKNGFGETNRIDDIFSKIK